MNLNYMGPASARENLYVKNNASRATYTYDVLTPPQGSKDFIAQANSEGARGYRVLDLFRFAPLGAVTDNVLVYIKDTAQSATFTYQQAPLVASAENAIVQANGLGAQGYVFLGRWAYSGDAGGSFYFKASNCTDWLYTDRIHGWVWERCWA